MELYFSKFIFRVFGKIHDFVVLNWHILLLSFSDKVKNTAVRADWVPMISKGARVEYSIPGSGPVMYKGVTFDEGLVLLLVEPVRYNNLKSADLNNVSFLLFLCECSMWYSDINFLIFFFRL
jgi:hypothetical protein